MRLPRSSGATTARATTSCRPMSSITFETLIDDFPDEDNQFLPVHSPAGVL